MRISTKLSFFTWSKKAIEKVTIFGPFERSMVRKGDRAATDSGPKGRFHTEGIAKSKKKSRFHGFFRKAPIRRLKQGFENLYEGGGRQAPRTLLRSKNTARGAGRI